MKKINLLINFGLIIIISFFPSVVLSQNNIQIKLTFGNYTNDQSAHKFYSNERNWEINNKKLSYSIDANNTRYVDTLILINSEIDSIIQLVKDSNLTKSVSKELNKDYLSKEGYSEDIIGYIELNGKKAEFKIKTNGYHLIDEDTEGKHLNALEQLLYKIVGNHKK